MNLRMDPAKENNSYMLKLIDKLYPNISKTLDHEKRQSLKRSYLQGKNHKAGSSNNYISSALQGRVLLVDDHPFNRKFAQVILKRFGLEVNCANSGVEALIQLVNTQYDLVLMDCDMPEMDGYQATACIREAESVYDIEHRLPIVAFTANDPSKNRARCLSVGMDDYLYKPCSKQQLYDMLIRWIPQPMSPAASPSTSGNSSHQHYKLNLPVECSIDPDNLSRK